MTRNSTTSSPKATSIATARSAMPAGPWLSRLAATAARDVAVRPTNPSATVTATSQITRPRPALGGPSRNTMRTAFRPAPTTPVPAHSRPARATRPTATRLSCAARRLLSTRASTPGIDRVRAASTSAWSPGSRSRANPTIDTPRSTRGKNDRKP